MLLLCCCFSSSSERSRMVKEGHDSTVRPKVQTYEFDNGRLFLDSWASDGKPSFSRRFLGSMRVLNVILCVGMGAVLISGDYGDQEHVFTPVQRGFRNWWQMPRDGQCAQGAERGDGRSSPRTKDVPRSVAQQQLERSFLYFAVCHPPCVNSNHERRSISPDKNISRVVRHVHDTHTLTQRCNV